MTYGVDASHAFDRNPSGVSLYSSQLIAALTASVSGDRFVLGYRSNRFLRALRASRPPNATRVLLEPPFERLWGGRVDLFHGLNQRLPRYRFRRTVVTFHDLFVMTGEYSTAEFRQRFTLQAREAAERADRIITVSAFTGDQVHELLGFPRELIDVVPHGVEPPAAVEAADVARFRERHALHGPLVLCVGAIQRRKNILRLIEAFESLATDAVLVLAGAGGYESEAVDERIERSVARARIRRLGYVSDLDRRILYQASAALAFPSLDEGFGLPILEAMAAGLPVVTSDRSAMPEVAGDAALLVDPFDVQAIAGALDRVLTDKGLTGALIARGRRRVATMTWESAAEKTLASYARALAG